MNVGAKDTSKTSLTFKHLEKHLRPRSGEWGAEGGYSSLPSSRPLRHLMDQSTPTSWFRSHKTLGPYSYAASCLGSNTPLFGSFPALAPKDSIPSPGMGQNNAKQRGPAPSGHGWRRGTLPPKGLQGLSLSDALFDRGLWVSCYEVWEAPAVMFRADLASGGPRF